MHDRQLTSRLLAAPGLIWLLLFFVIPLYTVLAVAMGSVDPIVLTPQPAWNPLDWNTQAFQYVFTELFTGGSPFQSVLLRTLLYVLCATVLSMAIAYPVAYFIARHAGRFKWLFLLGIVSPLLVSYLIRILAWVNLLQPAGLVNDVLGNLGLIADPVDWLGGKPITVILGLTYGWVPFMILPLFAFLDRIDPRMIEAAKDLGAGPRQAFRMVTLPMSVPGILAATVLIALPLLGDFFTPDLLSGSPETSVIGNQISLYLRGGQDQTIGAALVVVLMLVLAVPLVAYLIATERAARRVGQA